MTYQEAKAKSRYGGYKHIAWENKQGNWVGARLTTDTVKQAMLDTGTQGRFIMFDRGQAMYVWWSLAAMWLRQMKRGFFTYKS